MTESSVATSFFDDEGRQLLRALSRPAAYVDPHYLRNGEVVVRRTTDSTTGQPKAFSQSVWTKAVAFGFVCRSDVDRHWRLNDRGRLALRKALSRSGAPGGQTDVGSARGVSKQVGRSHSSSKSSKVAPVVNDSESPLAWLARRKGPDGAPLLRPAQFAAGERLREDFGRAHLHQRVTMDWSRALSGGGRRRGAGAAPELSDAALAARQRVNAALASVGPELSGILIDVCCYLKQLTVAERQAGWPQRSAKVVLLLALTRLARHYGLERAQPLQHEGRGPVVHWGQDDYRPDIG